MEGSQGPRGKVGSTLVWDIPHGVEKSEAQKKRNIGNVYKTVSFDPAAPFETNLGPREQKNWILQKTVKI